MLKVKRFEEIKKVKRIITLTNKDITDFIGVVSDRVTGNQKDEQFKKNRNTKTALKKFYPELRVQLPDNIGAIVGHVVHKSRTTENLRLTKPQYFNQVINDLLQEGYLYLLEWEKSEPLKKYKGKNVTVLDDLVFSMKYRTANNAISRYLYNSSRESEIQDIEENKGYIDDNLQGVEFDEIVNCNRFTDREKIVLQAIAQGNSYKKALAINGYSNMSRYNMDRLKYKVKLEYSYTI